jgi:hypothetical protein
MRSDAQRRRVSALGVRRTETASPANGIGACDLHSNAQVPSLVGADRPTNRALGSPGAARYHLPPQRPHVGPQPPGYLPPAALLALGPERGPVAEPPSPARQFSSSSSFGAVEQGWPCCDAAERPVLALALLGGPALASGASQRARSCAGAGRAYPALAPLSGPALALGATEQPCA